MAGEFLAIIIVGVVFAGKDTIDGAVIVSCARGAGAGGGVGGVVKEVIVGISQVEEEEVRVHLPREVPVLQREAANASADFSDVTRSHQGATAAGGNDGGGRAEAACGRR